MSKTVPAEFTIIAPVLTGHPERYQSMNPTSMPKIPKATKIWENVRLDKFLVPLLEKNIPMKQKIAAIR